MVQSHQRLAAGGALGRPKPRHRASSPEEAIRTLERTAVYDDALGFAGLLSRRCPQHALFEGGGEEDGCDEYRDEPSLLLMCVVGELLPEAPDKISCEPVTGSKTVRCLVTGRTEQRTIFLDHEGATWRLSAPPAAGASGG